MFNFVVAIILAGLLFPAGQAGFNFVTQKAVDYSYSTQSENEITTPQRLVNKSLGIKTTAKSILVIDKDSGKVLYDKNSQVASSIASISKLMAALVFLDYNPGFDQEITMVKEDQKEGGFVYLFTDEKVKVKDLFQLALIASSNEALSALARSTGQDNFIALMNQKAFELGMTNTYFADPTGLAPANVSTPADLVKLAQAAFARPEIAEAVKTKEYNFKVLNNQRPVKAESTDRLLGSFLDSEPYQIVGAKTGYLDEAGYCLLIEVKRAEGQTLILALLGASDQTSRWQEAKGLVDWVFANYDWPNSQ